MTSTITEHDLNACELIQALKAIEVEGVGIVENDILKLENVNLRNELIGRHEIKMLEHKRIEGRRLEILEKMVSLCKDEKERTRTNQMILSVSHGLDFAVDMLFQLSCDVMRGGQNDFILNKINQIHKLICKGKFELETFETTELYDKHNSQNLDMESKLKEIRQFDFNMIDINSYK